MKNNMTKLALNPCLITMLMFAGISCGYGQGVPCGFGVQLEECSTALTTIKPVGHGWTSVVTDSAGTGISCDGAGDATGQDDFPADACNYTETQYSEFEGVIVVVTGPYSESSTFDGKTCSGYCGG